VDTRHSILPIIRTKLYPPAVPRDHVRRDRLLARLDQALEVPLTLVSAPAGYGKSVLVSNWVRIREQHVAWLSLDETDSDLRQFTFYLLAALEDVSPGGHSEIADLLAAHELADECLVQLGYCIGLVDPVSVMVNTYGTGKLSDEVMAKLVREVFPLSPHGIIDHLQLREPVYRNTAAYGHFGRNEFTWERLDATDELLAKASNA